MAYLCVRLVAVKVRRRRRSQFCITSLLPLSTYLLALLIADVRLEVNFCWQTPLLPDLWSWQPMDIKVAFAFFSNAVHLWIFELGLHCLFASSFRRQRFFKTVAYNADRNVYQRWNYPANSTKVSWGQKDFLHASLNSHDIQCRAVSALIF